MKRIRYIARYLIVGMIVIVASCSGFDPLADFQQNESYEYKLFDILDDYPSLYSLVESLDQFTVNDYLAQAVSRKTPNYITSTNVRNETIRDDERPLQKSLQSMKAILERIINQDEITQDWHDEETTHADSLYALIDQVRDSDLGLEHDLVTILRAKSNYMMDVFDPEFLTLLTDDELHDIDDPNTAIVMDHVQRSSAKSLLQADYSIWLDSGGNVRTRKADIDTGSDKDLGLGNMVRGTISKLMALNGIIRNPYVRENIYGLIREYGNLSTAKIAGQNRGLPEILKDLMLTTESYFTVGGKDYETITDTLTGGYPFKIYGGSVDIDHTDNANIFSNAEARQIALSTNPVSMAMMIRADREGSLIQPVNPTKKVTDDDYEHEGNKHYLLDKLLVNLRNIGFDPESARLEETIYDLIRFDLHGRDRKTAVTDDDAWSVSFLESLLFLSGVAQNTGWADGGTTGERGSEPMDKHGHGNATEFLSFNDGLFSMGVLLTEAVGGVVKSSIYDAAFPNTSGNRVFRSRSKFTFVDRTNYKFHYDTNYSLQSLLTGPSAGEMGLPGGGNPTGVTPAINLYRPFTGDSLGDRNMTRWTYYNITRGCWHGEGPYYHAPSNAPTITADLDGNGARLWYVYYRPNGLIYAYVHKTNPSDPASWVYLSPADGHDPEVNASGDAYEDGAYSGIINDGRGRRQRLNRFRHTWYSEYYLIWYNDGNIWGIQDRYIAPRNDGTNNSYQIGTNIEPGRFVFHEILRPNQNNTRECASIEEAIYRNYVFTMNEKKLAVVIPLSLLAAFNVSGGGFKIVEANGTAGLTSARRYFENRTENHVWILQGNTAPSAIPGDYRQQIFWGKGYEFCGVALDEEKVWTSTLWGPSATPVASHAAPAITRFAFPRFNKTMNLTYGGLPEKDVDFFVTMGSGPHWFENSDADYNWNRRNGLLPVFVALLGTLWDFQNRNFAVEANRNQALQNFQAFAQNLVTSLSPRFYYLRKNTGAANYMKGTWVPRIRGGGLQSGNDLPGSPPNTNTTPHHLRMHVNAWQVSGAVSGNNKGGWGVTTRANIITYPEAAYGGLSQRTFFQPEPMRTMINRLYDSDFRDISAGGSVDRRCDGILALITEYDATNPRGGSNTPKTRLITGVFNILMALAGEEYDDPADLDYADPGFDENYENWGARRKLFYALEQSATGTRGTMGHVAQLIGDKPPFGIIFPSWMFVTGDDVDANGEFTSYLNARVDDIILDDELRISIGYDDDWDNNDPEFGIGSATVDRWDETDWDIFTKMLVMSGELTSDRGDSAGKYNITENVIDIIEGVVNKVNPTNDQIKALVHTGGILNAYYDGEWRYPTDKKKMALEYAKRTLEIGRGREYESGLFSRELFIGGGLVEYVLTAIDTPYSTRKIFIDLYRFLDDPLVEEPGSQFWNDVAEMSEGQLELIQRGMDLDPAVYFENIGYQYNGPMMYSGEIDYYGDLGRVFAR